MARSISARCINSRMVLADATRPPQAGPPPNCTPQSAHNNAYGFDFGGEHGRFSADVVFQHYNQAISVLNPLLGPQSLAAPYQSTTNSINTNTITGANLIDPNDTVYGIVTDNSAIMFAAKYVRDPSSFLPATNTSGRTILRTRWASAPGPRRLYPEWGRRQES